MTKLSFETQIMRLGEKQNIDELRNIINKTSIKDLKSALSAKLGRTECINFWNYLLQGFDLKNFDAREKRFACVKCFLDGLLKVELSYKQTYDLITRLCQDLSTFDSVQLVYILEHSMDGMRAGDPKCVSWKDLLPETLKVLAAQQELNVNSIVMSGSEYRDTTVRNLCTMRWPTAVLTPIADMFRELQLTAAEAIIVLNKFSGALQDLTPMELPALAFQLFTMCTNASHIIIPILAFEKYFHRFYYKKLFSDMNSNTTDFDSIDAYSDKELREAEETILHHLNYCTQYKISEVQLYTIFKNFLSLPDVMLTPFVLSAIICMTASNRDPDARLSTAILLTLLRTVIKHNEDERKLADYSVWCRDALQRKQVDLEQVFIVLIDQNKDGKDVITPGLVNLAFILLKAKNNPMLNSLAIMFLTKFIRKRFVFGQGIVRKIAEWMIVEQEQYQYSECLTLLSVADTFTISECVATIKYVMDCFLWLPGEQAMRMMSFILPILKLSNIVRDAFIEMLRKAMSFSDTKIRRMAVYGFCMILKQLNNSNSARTQSIGGAAAAGLCTQLSISGFSLMTQNTLGSRNNAQRNFDMLTLEILGLLRNCFNHTLHIKQTLYENLQRAVELNPKLVPHVLQFIDWYFRSFFEEPTDELDDTRVFGIKYEQLVHANDAHHNDVEVKDNLGCLILFVTHCLVIFEKLNDNVYDTRQMTHLLNLTIEKIVARELQFEENNGTLTHLKSELLQQQLNLIEALMAYTLLTSKQTNENVKNLLPLFKQHEKLLEALKSMSKKTAKKSKTITNTTADGSTNLTLNGVAVKKINTTAVNIWDLDVIEKMLRLLHQDIVPFANAAYTASVRSNVALVRYVLEVAALKVEGIRHEPEYKQLAHSKRMLKYLTDITKVIYETCIQRLPMLWRDFDLEAAALAAKCFLQCLCSANETYKKKFSRYFVKNFDFYVANKCKECPYIVQDIIDEFMQEDATAQKSTDALCKDPIGSRIPYTLLQCLEILYDNITYENRVTTESYTWLLHFCQTFKIETAELSLVHKLLFTQRQKTHSGAFFNAIAFQFGKVLGNIRDDDDDELSDETINNKVNFKLKSITLGSAESCLQYLFAALHKQIEDVEYFITKANNLSYKHRMIAEDDRTFCRANLEALDRAICMQLVHISKTLLILTNVCMPLGACMDGLMKLLMQLYICLKNLTRHYLNCAANDNVSISSTKYNLLLQLVGNPLPTNVYELIAYIERNVIEDEPTDGVAENKRKKSNPKLEKARLLRETKLIPKIILCIENFNKHVISLAKKTNERLANVLHFGTVRDFRIKTTELKAAVERTFSHSSQIVVDESCDVDDDVSTQMDGDEELINSQTDAESVAINENNVNASENEEVVEEVVARSKKSKIKPTKSNEKTKKIQTQRTQQKRRQVVRIDDDNEDTDSIPTPEDALLPSANNENAATTTQLLKNLAKINKTAVKKRTLRESEQIEDPDVMSAAPPPAAGPVAKKRRGRSAVKKS